jgi:hypothetical protein
VFQISCWNRLIVRVLNDVRYEDGGVVRGDDVLVA